MQWIEGDVKANGLRLHYQRAGGERDSHVLLLHGVTGNGHGWGLIASRLARDHDVILLDQRGHGGSEAPPKGYHLDDFARDAADVLTNLKAVPATVLGHSLGARVALRLAALRPDLVQRLILEDPPLDAQEALTGTTIIAADAARYAWFAWLREMRALPWDELLALRRRESPTWSEDDRVRWAESIMEANPVLWGSDGLTIDGDWRSELAAVRCPTLLVRGEPARGSIIVDEEARDAERIIAAGYVVQAAGAGHMVHLDQGEPFVRMVASFLAKALP